MKFVFNMIAMQFLFFHSVQCFLYVRGRGEKSGSGVFASVIEFESGHEDLLCYYPSRVSQSTRY